METITAADVVREITGEKIVGDAPQRFPEAAADGECFRQGDVYLIRRDAIPAEWPRIKGVSQLAPGNTQGSRHCLDCRIGVEMFRVPNGGELNGPWLRVNRERVVTHPEHGDVILPPGCYEVRYQRNLDEQERAVRVQD